MTIMAINDKQASITIYFFLYISIEYVFKPVQSNLFITPAFLRSCKVRYIFYKIKIIKLYIYNISRLAFID